MIVNVRGTHGSGKTTMVRSIMQMYTCKPIYMDGRRQPIGYRCKREGHPPLFVPGHYENPDGGGCDTIQHVDVMFGVINRHAKKGYDILYEGIVAQHSTPSVFKLKDRGYKIRVVVIRIPMKKALRSVIKRRKARGAKTAFNPVNVEREDARIPRDNARLKAGGVKFHQFKTRRAAKEKVLELLGLT